jgi:2-isopropylmalate synthase
MSTASKVMLAKQLEKLGVDVIEAGFPIASPDDAEAVSEVGNECRTVEVCGLARCNEKDIEVAMRALEKSARPRIHVFIATSDIHLEHKLKLNRTQVIEHAVAGITLARQLTDNIEFSPEDATRSDWDYLIEVLDAAVEAGAKILNIPDTVGYITPSEYGELIAYLRKKVRTPDDVVFSTHCHNDLGLAVANSLSGIWNGARQVECTINGIGERAGNATLEEIVMALKTRPDVYGENSNVVTTELLKTSKMLTTITGKQVQANKAIVGENAFAHEAGIHQHGVISNRLTYEIMTPWDIGFEASNLVLGKHSGRAALAKRFQFLGFDLTREQLDSAFVKFKQLADRKKRIYDEDLIMILLDESLEARFELLSAHVLSRKDANATATASIRVGNEIFERRGEGDGPVAAIFSCIGDVVQLPGRMVQFDVSALTPDREAVGIVNITRQEDDGTLWFGHGWDTDITIAAGKALIDLLNRRDVRLHHVKRLEGYRSA